MKYLSAALTELLDWLELSIDLRMNLIPSMSIFLDGHTLQGYLSSVDQALIFAL